MIGGILVLFIYITRLASNEIFSPSNKILLTIKYRFVIIVSIRGLGVCTEGVNRIESKVRDKAFGF
jgi:hypothetical protein